MNDERLNEFIRNVTDTYLYETLVAIFSRVFPEDSILLPILTLTKKYGMPVKNILPFINEIAEWCKQHDNISDTDRQSLEDLLSRSGFMTIGFSQEGDNANGNG